MQVPQDRLNIKLHCVITRSSSPLFSDLPRLLLPGRLGCCRGRGRLYSSPRVRHPKPLDAASLQEPPQCDPFRNTLPSPTRDRVSLLFYSLYTVPLLPRQVHLTHAPHSNSMVPAFPGWLQACDSQGGLCHLVLSTLNPPPTLAQCHFQDDRMVNNTD